VRDVPERSAQQRGGEQRAARVRRLVGDLLSA